ncbi:hypothetical protein BKA69DRAFT_1125969 [Paraphysoderma sedebokerense]|nr:hypothetical protein BKA69DRAFT_1125969 [Paraphysoderma sedebokerense]
MQKHAIRTTDFVRLSRKVNKRSVGDQERKSVTSTEVSNEDEFTKKEWISFVKEHRASMKKFSDELKALKSPEATSSPSVFTESPVPVEAPGNLIDENPPLSLAELLPSLPPSPNKVAPSIEDVQKVIDHAAQIVQKSGEHVHADNDDSKSQIGRSGSPSHRSLAVPYVKMTDSVGPIVTNSTQTSPLRPVFNNTTALFSCNQTFPNKINDCCQHTAELERLRKQLSDKNAVISTLNIKIRRLENEKKACRYTESEDRLNDKSAKENTIIHKLSAEVKVLKTRLSHYAIELKSSTETNDVLRRENSRLLVLERSLKEDIFRLDEQNKERKNKNELENMVDPNDLQEILVSIEDCRRRIESFKMDVHTTSPAFNDSRKPTCHRADVLGHFDSFLQVISSLKTTLLTSTLQPNQLPFYKNFLTSVNTTIITCYHMFQVYLSFCRSQLEVTKSNPLDPLVAVKDEVIDLSCASPKVDNLNGKILELENQVTKLKVENDKLKTSITGDPVNPGAENMRQLEFLNKELKSRIEHLEAQISLVEQAKLAQARMYESELDQLKKLLNNLSMNQSFPPMSPILSGASPQFIDINIPQLSPLKSDSAQCHELESKIRELTSANNHLIGLQKQFENTLNEWKSENVTLRKLLEATTQNIEENKSNEKSEIERASIVKLKSKLQEQKLKNRQLEETIHELEVSLQNQQKDLRSLVEDREHQMQLETDKTILDLQQQISQLHSQISQNVESTQVQELLKKFAKSMNVPYNVTAVSTSSLSGILEYLINVIDEHNASTRTLDELKSTISDHVKSLNDLRKENEELKKIIEMLESKYNSKQKKLEEQVIVKDNEVNELKSVINGLENVLREYDKMYESVVTLIESGGNESSPSLTSDTHPLPFLRQFKHLHQLHVSVAHNLNHNRQILDKLQTASEENDETKSQLHKFVSICTALEKEKDEWRLRCDEVMTTWEKKYQALMREKEKVEEKLKRLVQGVKGYVLNSVET